MIALPRLRATAFKHQLETGATQPMVLDCEDEQETAVGEYVIKLRKRVRNPPKGLAFEYLAWQLAGMLGIRTVEAALVELERELGDTLPHLQAITGARIKDSAGLNFGTKFLPAYTTWLKAAPVPEALVQAALEIFAFDAVVDNADRTLDKPNMLWRGDEILVIDHELVFAYVLEMGGRKDELADRFAFLVGHPFYGPLKGRTGLNLDRFQAALAGLTEDSLVELFASVPEEFEAASYMQKIADALRADRDNAHAVGEAILGVLQ